MRRLVIPLAAAILVGSAGVAAAKPPPSPRYYRQPAIDALAVYDPQDTCDPSAKPGVVAFRAMVLKAYPQTHDSGISRDCSIGGTSEHKEGRAWDWGVSTETQFRTAQEFVRWLLRDDKYGNHYARARRLGIMYIIWNGEIWGAYRASEGWRDYPCSGTTGCHRDHIHFSFSWDGAYERTSWWDGTPVTKTLPGKMETVLPRD